MGREEQAKAERAELRRAVTEEALGRVAELEEKIGSHKTIINRQGRALEALANVITAFGRDVMALQAAELARARPPSIWRRVAAYFRGLATQVREEQALVDAHRAGVRGGGVTIRRVPDDEPASADFSKFRAQDPPAVESVAEAFDRRALERLAGQAPEKVRLSAMLDPNFGEPEPARPPSHLHQYVKDGPFMYRCTVEGCSRRATIEEIASESDYLMKSAAAKEH